MQEEKMITIETVVQAPLETVWECYTQPEHIMQWNAASEDWHCPSATNDLRVGGEFHFQMAARDGSASFDFSGTYTEIIPQQKIAYTLGERTVCVTFENGTNGVKVVVAFAMEHQNSEERQRAGWQAILDRFTAYTISQHS